MLHFNTILHPTDFSPPSSHAWHLACRLAMDHGARLILVHVRPMSLPFYVEPCLATVPVTEIQLREELQDIAPTDSRLSVERHLLEGDPASTLLDFLQDTPVDLIVMGSHGRTGLGRLVMGSVAEELARKASCPVLIVKNPVPEAERAPNELLEPVMV